MLLAVAVIAAVELRYRAVGGFPTVWPGWTQVEFQWRVGAADPARTVYALGDSRVGWGFSEGAFEEELAHLGRTDLRAVNAALPAADLARTLFHVVHRTGNAGAGVLLLNFSPGSFYVFTVGPGSLLADLKLQDLLDDRITTWIGTWLYTYGMGLGPIWDDIAPGTRHEPGHVSFAARTVFADGFVNALSARRDRAPLDQAQYQLDSYRAWYQGGWDVPFPDEMTSGFPQRRATLIQQLREAAALGWRVVLVRLPVGPRMRALEGALAERWSPAAFAAELGVPFLDYQDDPRAAGLVTLDESHLAPDSARSMSRILARDLAELLPHELRGAR